MTGFSGVDESEGGDLVLVDVGEGEASVGDGLDCTKNLVRLGFSIE